MAKEEEVFDRVSKLLSFVKLDPFPSDVELDSEETIEEYVERFVKPREDLVRDLFYVNYKEDKMTKRTDKIDKLVSQVFMNFSLGNK